MSDCEPEGGLGIGHWGQIITQQSALSNASCYNGGNPRNALAPQHSALSTHHCLGNCVWH
ncbi:MAG: hypothetical protein KME32_17710 [Mojavia pulchra JT2-VF2]|uniref:Uncharacterized protein n=1 Tax=Mojavia pulchra JT2-VF2 TaxID=287848 RepID=A0A951PYP5_9NOST|nr:hypothetical protein [Mojavia pulchra JT2-VF2]